MNLTNRKSVRQFALAVARERQQRPHWTAQKPVVRVAKDFLDRAEIALGKWIEREIANMPEIGKTLR